MIVVAVICLLGTAFQRLVLRPDSTFGFPEVITLLQAGRLAECAIIPVLVAIGTYNRSPRVTALMLFVSFLILAVGWLHSSLPSTALFAIAALPLGLMFNFRDARALMNLANVALMIAVMSMPFLYFWITTYCGYAALKFWRSSKPESTNTTP